MRNVEMLKELYTEEFNKLTKIDIYKIVRKLQLLRQKEEILKSLELLDKKITETLPKSLRLKIDDLKTNSQITNYIGSWGALNATPESERLMDKEVYELRKEKAEEESKIENMDNHEVREYFYAFAKVRKIESLLKEEGILVELDDKNNIKRFYKNS